MYLPLSLFLSATTALSAVLPVHATELTPDNFVASITTGLWFIEFFSPYCGHCRAFAPTWNKLVETSAVDVPTVKFAQVNCVVHGDLCSTNDVQAYPTLTIYNNGQSLENFRGARDLNALQAFVKRHVDAQLPPPEPKYQPNPDGQVLDLTEDSFALNLPKSPMFVKFFAPWCGHCKKLAPLWKQLAHRMQNKLTVAEVNCDDHNALCKSHAVQGYPTLIYLTADGLRSEYNGGRNLEQLASFAEKTISAGLVSIKTEELDNTVKQNEVLYILLHAGTDHHIIETVRKAAAPLLGSPMIYSSSDPSLFTRFSIPQTSTWALIALKDYDAEKPSSIHHERESSEHKLITWLNTHRLPTTVELTQDTFQSVMNAPQAPLVLIAAVTQQNAYKVHERLRDLGKKWRLKTQGSGLSNGREVIFASMDAEKWKDWMKSMYGIQQAANQHEGLEGASVVITDHKRLVYWDTDPSDTRINLASTASVFATAEAAAAGKMTYKNSENHAERLARFLNQKMLSLETYVVTYPWCSVSFVLIIFVLAFLGLKRLIADDISADYRKVDRLD